MSINYADKLSRMLTLCAGHFWPHGHFVNKRGRGSLVAATYQIQDSRSSDFRQAVLSPLLGLTISDKSKSFPNNDIGKLATTPGGHIS